MNVGKELTTAVRVVTGEVLYVAFFGLLLFVPAGTLGWGRAWILLAVLFVVKGTGALRVFRAHRSLTEDRAKIPIHRDQPWIDKALLPAVMFSFACLIAFIAFERFHLRMWPEPIEVVRIGGLFMFAIGWWLVTEALRTNAFATTVVRHQAERGQKVVRTGVYRCVRHPMYAGLIPVMVGMSLWLGSVAGAAASTVPLSILIVRVIVEERLLREKLHEYEIYAAQVRYRLIPYIW